MPIKKGYEVRMDRGHDSSFVHGSRGAYLYYNCSCDECRTANRLYQKTLRGRTPPRHGNSGYMNYGCRCDTCSRAHSDYQWRLYPDYRKYYSRSWREANGFPPRAWAINP